MADSCQPDCRCPADNGGVTSLEWATLDTPVGPVSVGCGDAGVAHVRFGRPPAGADPAAAPEPGAGGPAGHAAGTAGRARGAAERRDLADVARRQLAEYFCGQRKTFELPLDWSGFAPAQRQVLGRLYDDVSWGQTVTYGNLAGLAGIRAAGDVIPARAVGQIMGSNPIPVIVPCHRVVASDGLGGFSGGAGPEVKRWLLILEGSVPPTLDWTPGSAPSG
jgi:methylated-DNA-[protein]-cysteine S-methyltransferase